MCQRSKYRHVFFHSSRVFFAFSSVKSLIKKQDSFFGKQTEAGFMINIFFSCFNDENCVDCVFGVQASLLQPISSKMSICFSNRNILNFCSHRHNLKIHKNTFFWALFACFVFFLRFFFPFSIYWKKNVLNGYTKKKSSSWPTSLNNLSHKPQQVSCPL